MTMHSISPDIPLTLGIIAGSLFVCVLIAAFVITMRNRRIIRKNSEYKNTEH